MAAKTQTFTFTINEDTKRCPTCGEPFYPGQHYYAQPYKQHAICRRYSDEFMLASQLTYQLWLINQDKK